MKTVEDLLKELNTEQSRMLNFAEKDLENLRFELKLFEIKQTRELKFFCEKMRSRIQVLSSNLKDGYPDDYFPEGEEPLPSIIVNAVNTDDMLKIENAIQAIREEGKANVERSAKANSGVVAKLSNVIRNRSKA